MNDKNLIVNYICVCVHIIRDCSYATVIYLVYVLTMDNVYMCINNTVYTSWRLRRRAV